MDIPTSSERVYSVQYSEHFGTDTVWLSVDGQTKKNLNSGGLLFIDMLQYENQKTGFYRVLIEL